MEPGPLPPHERTWRHPSELGPTRSDVDTGSGRHLTALAVGAIAAVTFGVAVVAMTPRPGSGPVAVSATTTPITTRATLTSSGTLSGTSSGTSSNVSDASLRPSAVRSTSAAVLTTFAAIPHAVAAQPQLDLDGTDVAERSPTGRDVVLVRTEDLTYRLPWAHLSMLDMPDGSVVYDTDGDLVARVSDGDLLILVDD